MAQREEIIDLVAGGGLDLVTPPISMRPGACIGAENYECVKQGYARMRGYERYSGKSKPSTATYYLLEFEGGTGEILAGDIVGGSIADVKLTALEDAVLLVQY